MYLANRLTPFAVVSRTKLVWFIPGKKLQEERGITAAAAGKKLLFFIIFFQLLSFALRSVCAFWLIIKCNGMTKNGILLSALHQHAGPQMTSRTAGQLQSDASTDGRAARQTDGQTEGRTEGQAEGQIEVHAEGQAERQIEGLRGG